MNAPQPMNLPAGIRSRFMENVNGLRMHILEAGYDHDPRPLILLLHGFPELAYSWRNIIVPLADLGYHVVAPDQRGFGRTTGWSNDYNTDTSHKPGNDRVRHEFNVLSKPKNSKSDLNNPSEDNRCKN